MCTQVQEGLLSPRCKFAFYISRVTRLPRAVINKSLNLKEEPVNLMRNIQGDFYFQLT